MSGATKKPEHPMAFQFSGNTRRSKLANQFIHEHPKQAEKILLEALEAGKSKRYAPDNRQTDDIPDALKPFVVYEPIQSNVLNVSQAAIALGVSRTTVYQWVKSHTLLGWASTKPGLTIPTEQIIRQGKVVSGIPQVLEIIEDPELAWEFLAEEWPFAEYAARPIDKLRAGQVEDVVNAAPSFGTAFT